MKVFRNATLSIALFALLVSPAMGGETHNPPVRPPCNPAIETCSETSTQSTEAPADETDTNATDGVLTDAALSLLNLTLSLIG